ncbi:Uncharacterized protein TCM_018974 [Theobroma cacao]|uniref:Uncharacterized protein n=1 Tax=Theobroma cacao TaxID=3641 RepID=A0A061EHA6_THECC|nr:Uncharacterized protein TCM_018974 [Theobroma cacao]
MLEQEEKEILPHQELIEIINLENGEEKKEVKIGTSLSSDERQKLEELLREYVDVFAWSYQDMPSLNTDIVVHKLPLGPNCKPIKQKLRRMKPEMLLKIKEEVKKQFDAGFLEMAKYPECVANIVSVPKKDGKVRMCVDYRDLNRASPKDSFPLPHIDTLVDNTAKHALFSFMDDFSGYNQIKMTPEDMEKTRFVTMWRTFCYKVMPFGLKNAGATYQRAMVALFHDMMHKEIEVYVDDMIAKSHTERDHTVNLKKQFERLRKFQLKLNPAKCTFGVTSGKLLGFIVSEKGIEVDPDKILAIQKLPPPKTQKEKERAVYYLSKKFMEYESKYSALEKMCCALAWTVQRLRQYMLYHTTWLVAKLDPIKYIFEKPCLFGRIARWQVLLSEYDIVYVSQKSIKGSAIADFLADQANKDYESVSFNFSDEDLMAVLHIENDGPNELNPWKMYFDGASNALGHEIGAVLISPNGKYYPATARLNFNCTNNMAEYEALVMGLQAAIEMKADAIDVYGDSALVICQVRGEWETRDSKLVPYKKLVTELSKQFKEISFNHLPREENQIVDALATLTAMFKIKEAADVRPFDLEVREVSAHCLNVEEEVDGKPWYHDIMQYIKH